MCDHAYDVPIGSKIGNFNGTKMNISVTKYK